MGGGIFMALGAIIGAVAGLYAGQPSIGLLVGLGAGGAAALIMARRKRG